MTTKREFDLKANLSIYERVVPTVLFCGHLAHGKGTRPVVVLPDGSMAYGSESPWGESYWDDGVARLVAKQHGGIPFYKEEKGEEPAKGTFTYADFIKAMKITSKNISTSVDISFSGLEREAMHLNRVQATGRGPAGNMHAPVIEGAVVDGEGKPLYFGPDNAQYFVRLALHPFEVFLHNCSIEGRTVYTHIDFNTTIDRWHPGIDFFKAAAIIAQGEQMDFELKEKGGVVLSYYRKNSGEDYYPTKDMIAELTKVADRITAAIIEVKGRKEREKQEEIQQYLRMMGGGE